MDANELITALRVRGIRLRVENGQVRYRAVDGALTAELQVIIRTHKQALLEQLGISVDGYCGVHGRFLTADEQQRGRCSWCFPDDRDWSDEQRAAIDRMNTPRVIPENLVCLECGARLELEQKYYCLTCDQQHVMVQRGNSWFLASRSQTGGETDPSGDGAV